MKSTKPILGFLAMLWAGPVLADIEIGQPREKVIQELGQPDSLIKSGAYEMLRYARGKVELKNNEVSFVELMSEASYLAWQKRWRIQQEEKTERIARALETIKAEAPNVEIPSPEARSLDGAAFKKRLLTDPNYLTASASKKTAIWRNFIHRYPKVDISKEYQEALTELHDEMQRNRRERELEDLKEQVDQAERRAELAERELERERAASRRLTTYTASSYPVHVYETPVPVIYSSGYSGGYSYIPTYRSSCNTRPYRTHSNSKARLTYSRHGGVHGSASFRF